MDYRAVDFLNNFETETRGQIIEFGKRISSNDLRADVYLVMARKAICLIDLMIKFHLANLAGTIVSERILDMDITWLEGKSITIIDDALVSGTSIKRKVIDKLERIGVKSIKVCVLAINEKWYNEDMLTDESGESYLVEPLNIQTDEKCMRSCYDIVKAFSSVPTPYDIDFPFFDEESINKLGIEVTEDTLNAWVNNTWLPVNVTSTSRISNKYSKSKENAKNVYSEFESITFYPPKDIENRIWNLVGIDRPNCCSLKMRTYIRKRQKDKEKTHVSFLPFAIIDKLSKKQIDLILQRLYPEEKSQNILFGNFKEYSSRFRFIQFIVACLLANEFFADMGLFTMVDGKIKFPEHNTTRASYIFHESTLFLLEEYQLCRLNPDYSMSTQENLGFEVENNSTVEQKSNVEECMDKMFSLFSQLYEKQEKLARELAKKHGKRIFTDPSYKTIYEKHMTRLDRGYTFKQIVNVLPNINNAEYVASTFLDYAIDIGVAVPITYVKGKYVSRAYRHGEDVIFADKEAKQLAFMLHIFSEEAKTHNGISAILVEKLLTSFIRVGLARSIFEKYDYGKIHEKERDYLKIVYNLHGSTVRVLNSSRDSTDPLPYMTNDDASQWLRDILVRKKLLKVTTKNKEDYYTIPERKQLELYEEHSISNEGAEAERIASTFAYFFNNNDLTTEDLILINATLGYEQIIPALLAEVEIIKTEYLNRERYFVSKYILTPNAINTFKGLRNWRMFIAINSAEWKFKRFKEKYAINKLKDVLSKENRERSMQLNWRQYWLDKLSNIEEVLIPEIDNLYDTIVSYILQFGILIRLLEYIAFQRTIGPTGVEHYFSDLIKYIPSELKNRTEKLLLIKEFNENKSWTSVLSYFDICDFEINTNSIYKTEEIENLAQGKPLLDKIDSQLILLKKHTKKVNLKYPKFLDMVDEVLINHNFSDMIIEGATSHLDYLVYAIDSVQKKAAMYINARGHIEKPIFYKHAIVIESLNDKLKIYESKIEKIINMRKKKIRCRMGYSKTENGYIVFMENDESGESLFNLAKEINIAVNIESDFRIAALFNLEEHCCPIGHNDSISPINQKYFWSWYKSIRNIFIEQQWVFIIVQISKESEVILKLTSKFERTAKTIDCNEGKKEINVMGINAEINQKTILRKTGFCIGIITALDEELEGVRKALEKKFQSQFVDDFDKHENFKRNLVMEFEYENNIQKIILTKSNPGETAAANTYSSLARYNLDYIFLCGIAGTCKDDIDYGHVFIPFEIYSSVLKKENEKGDYIIRGESYKISSHHTGLLESFISECNYRFKVSNDAAISDNVVIANKDSEILRKVKQFNDKIACVEMESVGIFSADYSRNKSKLGVYMIRGVSDKADSNKNDDYHTLAVENAATVLADLLEFLYIKRDIIKKIK